MNSNTEPSPLPPRLTPEEEAQFIKDRRERDERRRQRDEDQPDEASMVKPAPLIVETRGTVICGICEKPFDGVAFAIGDLPPLRKLYCDPCCEQREKEMEQLTRKARSGHIDGWDALCEPEFRSLDEGGNTDINRLSSDCPKLASVTGWKFGPEGLLIRGSTGRCKTRATWRLLRKQFEAGRKIVATTSGRFAREFADAAGNHRQTEWFEPMVRADIFFMDDLGKKPWTPNVWGEFFELIDERAKHGRPFIITTNEDRETLRKKCADAVTWEPLLRRLTENTKALSL